ncbi:MAG TPA: DUF4177 domain-containing protein [Ktedonobacteraceae bacterium]
MKWEYRTLTTKGSSSNLHYYDSASSPLTEEKLDQLGDDDWELVTVISVADLNGETQAFEYIFKRPKSVAMTSQPQPQAASTSKKMVLLAAPIEGNEVIESVRIVLGRAFQPKGFKVEVASIADPRQAQSALDSADAIIILLSMGSLRVLLNVSFTIPPNVMKLAICIRRCPHDNGKGTWWEGTKVIGTPWFDTDGVSKVTKEIADIF